MPILILIAVLTTLVVLPPALRAECTTPVECYEQSLTKLKTSQAELDNTLQSVQETKEKVDAVLAELNKGNLADRIAKLESQLSQLQQKLTTQTEAITIDNGNVGIGTNSPKAKLDVAGDIRFNNNPPAPFTLFIKPGNNGTMSCDEFCATDRWGRRGGCIGSFNVADASYRSLECKEVKPEPGTHLFCVCVIPLP